MSRAAQTTTVARGSSGHKYSCRYGSTQNHAEAAIMATPIEESPGLPHTRLALNINAKTCCDINNNQREQLAHRMQMAPSTKIPALA
jgi:hypothetical protein